MFRAMIPTALVLMLNLIGVSHPAMAFTLRFGPVSVTEDPALMHERADTDLPTPRMLNVSIGPDGLIFGPTSSPRDERMHAPEVTIRSKVQPRDANEPSAPLTSMTTNSRQLSGAEIMLLRHAKQVAGR